MLRQVRRSPSSPGEISGVAEISPTLGEGDQWREYGDFGAGGFEVGETAVRLARYLREQPESNRRGTGFGAEFWEGSDGFSFDAMVELDTGVRFIEPRPELAGELVGDPHRDLEDLRVALPFSEGERRWMYRDRLNQGTYGQDGLEARGGLIRDGGLLRPVYGSDLARRWWTWRRGLDEFSGQGGAQAARLALAALAQRLIRSELRALPDADVWTDF